MLVKAFVTCLFYVRSAITTIKLRPAVIHAHDLDTLVPAIFLKWVTGAKLVFDSHEDYPAMLREDLGRMGYWLTLAAERLLLNAPDVVIASNQAISKKLAGYVDSFVVENFVDLEWFDRASAIPITKPTRPIVVYVGEVGAQRGLEQLLQALPMMKCEIDIVVGGDGPLLAELKKICQKQHIPVRFPGFIDRDAFPRLICSAIVGVILFQPTPNNVNGLPNKLFDYMAGGLPVIASDFPLMHQIIHRHQCGLTVDPTSPRQIAEAVDYLVLHPAEARRFGANGRKAVEERYSWASNQHKLLDAYAALGA
jgi:glycosyltransferase involved in cell wall biosynthesis